nr:Chain C, Insulin mimetic peptide S597 [synthetic construct]8DTL_D Chain D, Insulin mimetic peptide S597 [synthetic construct]
SLEEEWAQIECEVYGRGCPSESFYDWFERQL